MMWAQRGILYIALLLGCLTTLPALAVFTNIAFALFVAVMIVVTFAWW